MLVWVPHLNIITKRGKTVQTICIFTSYFIIEWMNELFIYHNFHQTDGSHPFPFTSTKMSQTHSHTRYYVFSMTFFHLFWKSSNNFKWLKKFTGWIFSFLKSNTNKHIYHVQKEKKNTMKTKRSLTQCDHKKSLKTCHMPMSLENDYSLAKDNNDGFFDKQTWYQDII